jgi:hypothetical protein
MKKEKGKRSNIRIITYGRKMHQREKNYKRLRQDTGLWLARVWSVFHA